MMPLDEMRLFDGLKRIQEDNFKKCLGNVPFVLDFMPYLHDKEMVRFAHELGIAESRLAEILSGWHARGWWDDITTYAGLFNTDGTCPTADEFRDTYWVPFYRLQLDAKLAPATCEMRERSSRRL